MPNKILIFYDKEYFLKKRINIAYLFYIEKFSSRYIELFNIYSISKLNVVVILAKKFTLRSIGGKNFVLR